ncbi:MAG: uroporphyrinogen decarboxylase family protein [Armatimonadota bacterium]
MTSRERVLRAIAHQPTDRMPADYHAHQQVTDRLVDHLGLQNSEELLQLLQIDMRRVGFSYYTPNSAPDAEGYVRNMWGMRTHPDKPDGDLAKMIYPFDEDTTVDEVYAHPWPSADALDYSGIAGQCAPYHDEYATYGSPWCPFFHEVGWLIGQENYLIWMHTRPDLVDAITDCIVSFEIEVTRRFFEACNGKLDIAFFGNDFGTQRGLFISPDLYQRFLRQPLKRFFDLSHDFGCKVMQHSCGSVCAIIPWLVEDGVDILNPIQMRAEGMNLPALAQEYGGKITFHGGVDTQHTLPFGDPDEVREQVRSYRALTRDAGGYILCSSQDLIDDIPEENILAMYEEELRV